MPAAILGPVAGAVVGGLMSDGGEQQTATKEPWSVAAPWLRENSLSQGQNLQAYYQQNPGTTSSRRPTRTRLPTLTSSATPWPQA